MKATQYSYLSNDFDFAKLRDYRHFCLLSSNEYHDCPYSQWEYILAVGKIDELSIHLHHENPFEKLYDFWEKHRSWLFGFLTYDIKNDIENLSSENIDGLGFPLLHFFVPEKVYFSKTPLPTSIFEQKKPNIIPKISPRIDKKEYRTIIEKIRQHIIEGDIYELNFCQEFFAQNTEIDPFYIFQKLNQTAKAPFSAFYRLDDKYILSASPERFLKKQAQQLISQPIKGTARRGKNEVEDEAIKKALYENIKERAENVMIVDLVRNDLARSCQAGTIGVEELFGIYTFNTVHQMISTVVGKPQKDVNWATMIKNAFPMGSMTGAPKIMSMELIEKYEKTKRGVYSGSIGYISPAGDFDLNVVIRSILYNDTANYLSFQVGGAIVYDSVPEKEYEECLLKAENLFATLNV
jgi:para-aminobenzoate synthetase component 1